MAVKLKSSSNSLLKDLLYTDMDNIKQLLRNWSSLEALSLKGNDDATCILVDLQQVTGIDIRGFNKQNLDIFIAKRNSKVLTRTQFIAISFVLVLGYSQYETASILGVTQPVVCRSIKLGIGSIFYHINKEKEGE